MSDNKYHPLYTAMLPFWELCRDSHDGSSTIKSNGTMYLPPTSGQVHDGQGKGANTLGEKDYQAYKKRAVYPDYYAVAVEAAIGIMHREEAFIELPEALEPLRENATLKGEPLLALLRRINAEQLITGRCGLLGDVQVVENTPVPILHLYEECNIMTWSEEGDKSAISANFIVLDESTYVMQPDFTWDEEEVYRVLTFGDNEGNITIFDETAVQMYGTTTFDDWSMLGTLELEYPAVTGENLDVIPFAFINSKDLSTEPDKPPLLQLAEACLTIYRGEADYRQNLFMQGQDTLVITGGMAEDDEDVRIGAGARIDLPEGGDAKYIGVTATGLAEQRQALENDYARALQKSGQLLDSGSKAKESGDALKIRVAAQTATLPVLAKTGAAGLEKVLKNLATWFGADPEQVSVMPNLNFTEADLNGQTLLQIIQAKTLGAPISEESVHEWMVNQGFTSKDYETEIDLLSAEEPPPGAGLDSPVDQQNEDEELDPVDENADE